LGEAPAGVATPQPGGGAAPPSAARERHRTGGPSAGDGCAVVSGAASGIGRACAAALRADGLAVAALDLAPADGVDLALTADVADAEAVEAAVARAEAELGPVVVVVTAAGYYERAAVGATGVGAWRRMLAVQLGGTVNLVRSTYSRMRARGAGSICTIGSELALCGDADAAHYAAAKGAIHAFTKSLAVEAAPHGVRVNCVAPGPTDTPLMTPEMRSPAYLESLVLKRLVTPAEIAAAVLFVTCGAHNMVGQVVSPNAGAVV
jgi:NAD(P)-dependent dehydrogenase (short-subunit alcohol dehydrogenase family)